MFIFIFDIFLKNLKFVNFLEKQELHFENLNYFTVMPELLRQCSKYMFYKKKIV